MLKKNRFWFFVSAVGDGTYINVLSTRGQPEDAEDDFSFRKLTQKGYGVFSYFLKGDVLKIHYGDMEAMKAAMVKAKFGEESEGVEFSCYKTPRGWLAAYLKDHGESSLFSAHVRYSKGLRSEGPADLIKGVQVNPAVNKVANEGPELHQPADSPAPGLTQTWNSGLRFVAGY